MLLLVALILLVAGVIVSLVQASSDAWKGTGGIFVCVVLLFVVRTRMPKGRP
ncbi:hypothetical protein [Kineococcus sp. NPDC059986]|uniref:hypothetical protein n=1 Tax=Kineococcus sp. NPDC059986 TaxID=3155538 RepID=UPI0034501BC0